MSMMVWFCENSTISRTKSGRTVVNIKQEICSSFSFIPVCDGIVLVYFYAPEQWNGGSDRFAAGLIRYFTNAGHRIIWLTTMIDEHWA